MYSVTICCSFGSFFPNYIGKPFCLFDSLASAIVSKTTPFTFSNCSMLHPTSSILMIKNNTQKQLDITEVIYVPRSNLQLLFLLFEITPLSLEFAVMNCLNTLLNKIF
jgi:hypothetical protein